MKHKRLFLLVILVALVLVFFFGMLFFIEAESFGPSSPGTVANDASIGIEPWGDPSNAISNDGNYAIGTVTPGITQYLKATNFGFAIPVGATIDGISVSVNRARGGLTESVLDHAVRLVKGGTIMGENKSIGATWDFGSLNQITTFGSDTDLWGLAWTASDLNSSNFGVALAATTAVPCSPGPCVTQLAKVDHITITVHYTEATIVESHDDPLDSSATVIKADQASADSVHSIEARVGIPFLLTTQPPETDRLRRLYVRTNGAIHELADDNQDLSYETRLSFSRPGAYPYALTAEYGSTTRTEYGIFIVKGPSSLISRVNQLFRLVFMHDPSRQENSYWQTRIKEDNKSTLPELIGAMQWQKLFEGQ